jgi:AraC-like DNA-binding protein
VGHASHSDSYLDTHALDEWIPPEVLNRITVRLHGKDADRITLPSRIPLDRSLRVLLSLIRKAEHRTLHETTRKFLIDAAAAHIVETQAASADGKTPALDLLRFSERRMQQLEDYVQAHLTGNVRVEDLARHMGMSRARFVERFKATTGTTPHRFVLEARVRHARMLLADGWLSLAEIARLTGFSSPSHFAAVFRRLVQSSPSAYRRQVITGGARAPGPAQAEHAPQPHERLAAMPASASAAGPPAPGLMEFQLEQTSLPLNRQVRLLKSSLGLGWTDLFAAVTDEQPHEGLRGAVPAVWVVTSSGTNSIHRIGCEGKHNGILPQRAISITGSGQAVYDELGFRLQARHLYLRQQAIDEVAREIFKGSDERRFIGSSLGRHDPVLYRLITAIRIALDAPPQGNRLRMDCLTQALAAHLLAQYSVAGAPRALPVHALNARQTGMLSDYINDNLSSNLGLSELAGLVGLNRAQFIERFKATALMTPHRFVILRRIKQAQKLLAQPGADFALVALACGFADQSHFTATFKQIVGMTPGRYWRMMG